MRNRAKVLERHSPLVLGKYDGCIWTDANVGTNRHSIHPDATPIGIECRPVSEIRVIDSSIGVKSNAPCPTTRESQFVTWVGLVPEVEDNYDIIAGTANVPPMHADHLAGVIYVKNVHILSPKPPRDWNSSYFGSKCRSWTARARCLGASSLPSTNAS